MNAAWAKAAGIRCLKTFCQTLASAIAVTGATIGSIDWKTALSTSALAAILSILTSLAGLPEVGSNGAENSGN